MVLVVNISIVSAFGWQILFTHVTDKVAERSFWLCFTWPPVAVVLFFTTDVDFGAWIGFTIAIVYRLIVLWHVIRFVLVNYKLLQEIEHRQWVAARHLGFDNDRVALHSNQLKYRSRLFKACSTLIVSFWIIQLVVICI